MKNIAYICIDKNTPKDEKESNKYRNAREA